MDSFWSKLLILGIVAAIGVFFIANVYGPQRSAQEAMAESTQQSVNAVKSGVDDMAPLSYNGDDVINTVTNICRAGNTMKVVVVEGGTSYIFTTEPSYSGQNISTIVDSDKHYLKETSSSSIIFTEQS
jgi:exosome complex RNA-binding protein Csl4